MFVQDDPVSAEPHLRAAYEIRPSYSDLENLGKALFAQNKTIEIAQVAQDYARRMGQEPTAAILLNLATRSEWKATLEAIDRYEREGSMSRAQVAGYRVWTYMRTGRLREAQPLLREHMKARGTLEENTFTLAWLKMREGGRGDVSHEELARVGKSLLILPLAAVFAVETGTPEPLAGLIERFEQTEQGSQNQFVHEELQFARGCLAFARGDLKTARKLIEPLASNGEVAIGSHVLGRLYEAQGLWPEAAAQYDGIFGRPNTLAMGWPALWSLDRFRLAQVYERLGDKARARELYERFVADWKDGDLDIPELVTARQRLAVLSSGSTSPSRSSSS